MQDTPYAYLIVQIVVVLGYKHLNVSHDLEYVKSLLQSLTRQVRLGELQSVLLGGDVPHLTVLLPVVQGHRGEVVEGDVQVVLY